MSSAVFWQSWMSVVFSRTKEMIIEDRGDVQAYGPALEKA